VDEAAGLLAITVGARGHTVAMTGAGSHCGRRLLGKQASMTSTAEVGSQCGRQNSWASELDAARGQASVVAQGMRRERLKRMTKLGAGGRHVETANF
jgi:hypothetical protein